jgi:protein phosphatase
MTTRYRAEGRTDVGCKRANNQDAFGIARLDSGLLVVLADGMGGHKGGEVASQMVVDSLIDELPRKLQEDTNTENSLVDAGQVAHCAVRQKATHDINLDNMGTTLVAVYCDDQGAHITHAGDSRCYLLRDGGFTQLTKDHSVVQEMVDGGALSEAEAETSPLRNMLTNSLGAATELPRIDYQRLSAVSGDKLLLCSDGLSNTLSADQINGIITDYADDLGGAVDELIDQSLKYQASDNVTVILVQVD